MVALMGGKRKKSNDDDDVEAKALGWKKKTRMMIEREREREREGEEGAIASFNDKEQGEAIRATSKTKAPEEAREVCQGQGLRHCSQESSQVWGASPHLPSSLLMLALNDVVVATVGSKAFTVVDEPDGGVVDL